MNILKYFFSMGCYPWIFFPMILKKKKIKYCGGRKFDVMECGWAYGNYSFKNDIISKTMFGKLDY